MLRSIDERIARLAAEGAAPPERRADPLWLDGIKYLFVTAIEGSSTWPTIWWPRSGGEHLTPTPPLRPAR